MYHETRELSDIMLHTTSVARTERAIPMSNEYQLRLGRQRQVWFIPLADKRGVCR